MAQHRRRGFTLIELSMVFVVIGLLAGGVVAGRNLIRAAELRSILNDRNKYIVALNGFKDKYSWLPGDMSNAVRYWNAETGSTSTGVDATCAASQNATPQTATCNGDGSGFIADSTVANQTYEAYRAWQHLSNAGLIQGMYAGTSLTGGRTGLGSLPDANVPKSNSAAGAGWLFASQVVDGYIANGFYIPSSNLLLLGAGSTSAGPMLTPSDAWTIDTKVDDGLPGRGAIKSYRGDGTVNPNCTIDGTDDTDYQVSNTAVACSLIFIPNIKGN